MVWRSSCHGTHPKRWEWSSIVIFHHLLSRIILNGFTNSWLHLVGGLPLFLFHSLCDHSSTILPPLIRSPHHVSAELNFSLLILQPLSFTPVISIILLSFTLSLIRTFIILRSILKYVTLNLSCYIFVIAQV